MKYDEMTGEFAETRGERIGASIGAMISRLIWSLRVPTGLLLFGWLGWKTALYFFGG